MYAYAWDGRSDKALHEPMKIFGRLGLAYRKLLEATVPSYVH